MIRRARSSRTEWGERLLLLGGACSLWVALSACWPRAHGIWQERVHPKKSPAPAQYQEAPRSPVELIPKELARRSEAARPHADSSPETIVAELLGEEHRRRGEAPASASAALPPKAPEAQLRTVWIQWGPPRSEVYLDGKRVGQTPYAGQYACVEGQFVKIQILPQGPVAPIEKMVPCGASTIRLGAAEAVP